MRLATLLLCAWVFAVLCAAPAAASCATDAPVPSPDAFVGTVIATSQDDRVAEVVTDEGETVIVRGSPDANANTFTSVDRRYELGGRYEFHPLNDDSPYEDNDCTATRKLSGPALSAVQESEAPDSVLPEELPVDEQAGPFGDVVFFGSIIVGAVALLAVLRVRRRRVAGVS